MSDDWLEQAAQVLRSGRPSLEPQWPPELRGVVAWATQLRPSDLPPAPWKLDPWHTITDNAKWLASLAMDIRQGANGPRARTGGLQHDLKLLDQSFRDRAGDGLGF